MKIKLNKAYHCRTEELAIGCLKEVEKMGICWISNGQKPTTKTNWETNKENTYYTIEKWGNKICLLCGNICGRKISEIIEYIPTPKTAKGE